MKKSWVIRGLVVLFGVSLLMPAIVEARTLEEYKRDVMVLANENRFLEAETLAKEALGFIEANLGADHPDAAMALHVIGNMLTAQGKQAEAQVYFQQAQQRMSQANFN